MSEQEFESAVFKHGTPQGLAFYHWSGDLPACRKCLKLLDREVEKATGFKWDGELPGDEEIRERRRAYHNEYYNPNRPAAKAARARREQKTLKVKQATQAIIKSDTKAALHNLERGFLHVRHHAGTETVRECALAVRSMLTAVDNVPVYVTYHNRFEPIIDEEFLYRFYDGPRGAYLLAARDSLEEYDDILSPLAFFMYCGQKQGICTFNHSAPENWEQHYMNDKNEVSTLHHITVPTAHWSIA